MSSTVGIGQLILRLIQFNEGQQKREGNTLEFWRAFVNDFFVENATYKYIVFNEVTRETRTFELGRPVLARFFKGRYDSGVRDEVCWLENPREYSIDARTFLMNCQRARVVTAYDASQVHTYGHLRVTFGADLKILSWEFEAHKHIELVARPLAAYVNMVHQQQQQQQAGAEPPVALPPSPLNEYGVTPQAMRYYEIAEVVHCLEDLMDHSLFGGRGPKDSLATFVRGPTPTAAAAVSAAAAAAVAAGGGVPAGGSATAGGGLKYAPHGTSYVM